MKSLQRIVWSEGMLMMPQHLQQLDSFHERLLSQTMREASPYSWGVSQLEFDLSLLRSGQIRIGSFSGVMPNGLPVSFDAEAPEAPPVRGIEEHFEPTQRVAEVFLAIPREKEGNINFAGLASNSAEDIDLSRFRVQARSVVDLTSREAASSINFGYPNLSIRFGNEAMDDFEAIKVAELVRDSKGNFQFAENYIPPCLQIGASPWILNRLRQTQGTLVAKQRDLVQNRKQPDAKSVEFGPSDVLRGLQLLGINQVLPLIQHLVDVPESPPLQAYLALSQVAGTLCTFSPEGDPSELSKFNFMDLRKSFDSLFEKISAMLGIVAKTQYISIALDTRGDGAHFGSLDDERLLGPTQYILAVASQLPEAQVSDVLPKVCQIASWGEIEQLFQAAAQGLPANLTHRPPSEIPLRPGVVYFQLPTTDRFWQAIASERKIAIYIPPPFDNSNTKIELLAIPSSGPGTGPGGSGSGGSNKIFGSSLNRSTPTSKSRFSRP